MSMEDFYCDVFDLSSNFSMEEFDKDAFLKEVGVEDEKEYADDEGDVGLSLFFGSREEPPKQHAHLRILFRPDKDVRVSINYHQAGTKAVDQKTPYLEDCTQWLSRFLKKEESRADVSIVYDFDEGFATAIPLPFPLVASSKALSGLKVTGLSLQYPSEALVETAIIQRDEKGVFLFFQKTSLIRWKEFDLYSELKKLTPIVDTLVRPQEKTNGDGQENT